MPYRISHILRRPFVAITALVLALGACKDQTGPAKAEPEVTTMRITLANGATASVNAAGTVTGSLSIPAGTSTAFTVEFLTAAGVADPLVTAAVFQASVTPNTGITFTRTGNFAGTLRGAAAGTVTVRFGLLHIEENHDDFGPFPVPVTVTGAN